MEEVDPLTGLRTGAVSRWIISLDCGATAPLTFRPLGVGKSNLVSSVTDANGQRWVLRRPPVGPIAQSAHDIAREYRILVSLCDSIPVPRPIALCTDPDVTDAPLMLLEFVDGAVLDNLDAARRMDQDWRREATRSAIETLSQLHDVSIEDVGLADLAKHKDYAGRQLARWQRQWVDLESRELPVVLEIGDRLAARMPVQNEVSVVHGDFHLRNLIFDEETGDVRGVVDWELCTLGDPLADLGGLLAYWPRPQDNPNVPTGASVLDGFPERDELVSMYAQVSGRDVSEVAFWQALAYWKIAIIIEGVRMRSARRGKPVPGYDEQFVDALLVRAGQVLDRDQPGSRG